MNVGDRTTTTTFKGTVTSVKWTDPYAYFYLDVVEADGKVTNWAFDINPATLTRTGMNRDSLKQGDQITVDAFVARNGNKSASARVLTWPDGHSVVVGGDWIMLR
jgi:hypothetical protein